MKKRIIIAVVALLILVIVALTFFRSTPFHYSGVAEAISVDISARLSDTIQEILVEEGSPVTQGQVVARLTCDAANLKKEINAINKKSTALSGRKLILFENDKYIINPNM